MTDQHRPHVVILGGGFGGLHAARALRNTPVRITVVDRRNHHLFQPLLYQVATAALNPGDIARPIRAILRRQRNAAVILAEASGIDRARRTVQLRDGAELTYDWLVVATGATHSYFGHDEWAAHAPGLKTIEDALEIRRRMLSAYEAAEREPVAARRSEWLTFVVVGGGPTGVELAGALAEVSRLTLALDFRHIDPTQAHIVLVEGLPRILPGMAPELSEKARAQLVRLGVEVRTGARVTAVDARGIDLPSGRIEARTVLWAAGVAASPLARSLGVPLDRAGRVLVRADLSLPEDPAAFVIGDLAAFPAGDGFLPGLAPVAMQQGRHVARVIGAAMRGAPRPPFRYRDKGTLATVGRAAGVVQIGKLRLSGPIAWLVWLVVHIFFLIGFRNRVLVLLQWAWAYFTHERGARLITGAPGPTPPDRP